MKLSEELVWRGLVNQTTFPDLAVLDGAPLKFYLGVDPSADSMQVGNLAIMMLVRRLVEHGHQAVLLVGGATGMIRDPDGKRQERDLKTLEQIEKNKRAVAHQFKQLLGDQQFELVDNFDWFKDMNYLEFLREVGKHVPLRQMHSREFVTSRLDTTGISYAEFSYVLIQAYDFLHLYQNLGVALQVCGADQWGNCIAGVDLIRRKSGGEAHVFSIPLVVNKSTGRKFGKSEDGAVWLDPAKTSPSSFYQFWVNVDDAGVEDYLKIYTTLGADKISEIMNQQTADPASRPAQKLLAQEVTRLVHGSENLEIAEGVTAALVGEKPVGELGTSEIATLKTEVPAVKSVASGSIVEALAASGLASSNTEARRLLAGNAVSINGVKIQRENFETSDFLSGRLLLRRGKAFKDSALVEAA